MVIDLMAALKACLGGASEEEIREASVARCVECGATDTVLKMGDDGQLRCIRRSLGIRPRVSRPIDGSTE